jgi:hypothetical protein
MMRTPDNRPPQVPGGSGRGRGSDDDPPDGRRPGQPPGTPARGEPAKRQEEEKSDDGLGDGGDDEELLLRAQLAAARAATVAGGRLPRFSTPVGTATVAGAGAVTGGAGINVGAAQAEATKDLAASMAELAKALGTQATHYDRAMGRMLDNEREARVQRDAQRDLDEANMEAVRTELRELRRREREERERARAAEAELRDIRLRPAAAAPDRPRDGDADRDLFRAPDFLARDREPDTRIKLIPLSSTDGNQWVTFRRQFENAVHLNRWNDDVARRQLFGNMAFPASAYVEHIDHMSGTYRDVNAVLDEYQGIFLSTDTQNEAVAQFNVSRQKADENILQFHNRLILLFRRAYPEVVDYNNDRRLTEHFIRGLREKKIVEQLNWRERESLTATLAQARRLHSGSVKTQDMTGVSQGLTTKADQPGGIHAIGASSVKTVRKATMQDVCFYCNNKGHFSRDCPAKKVSSSSSSSKYSFLTKSRKKTTRKERQLFYRSKRRAYPLYRRPGQNPARGRWRKVRVPRRRFYRTTPGVTRRRRAIFALLDDDEAEEDCVEVIGDPEDPDAAEDCEELWYLDTEDEDEASDDEQPEDESSPDPEPSDQGNE